MIYEPNKKMVDMFRAIIENMKALEHEHILIQTKEGFICYMTPAWVAP